MVDNEYFVRAICADPFNVGLRLVYCDWLREQGEEDRADFIMVQCALSTVKRRARTCSDCQGDGSVNGDWEMEVCARCKGRGCVGGSKNSWKLGMREVELLDRWVGLDHGSNCKKWIGMKGSFANRHESGIHGGWSKAGISVFVEFRRGMIERVRTSCASWLEVGPEIVTKWPVTRVELNDRKPDRELLHVMGFSYLPMDGDDSPENGWWTADFARCPKWTPAEYPHVIPWRIWDRAMGMRTKNVSETDEDCVDWLSRGCVAWARDRAGMDPIRWPSVLNSDRKSSL